MSIRRFTHLGLCVSDLERSLRFYREGLGFEEDSARPPLEMSGPPASTLLELPELALRAVYLVRDGFCLELLDYPTPGVAPGETPLPMNRPGFTHLSFQVDDLDAAAARVAELGGRVLEASRIPDVALFVTDPDGTRIELVVAR